MALRARLRTEYEAGFWVTELDSADAGIASLVRLPYVNPVVGRSVVAKFPRRYLPAKDTQQ